MCANSEHSGETTRQFVLTAQADKHKDDITPDFDTDNVMVCRVLLPFPQYFSHTKEMEVG